MNRPIAMLATTAFLGAFLSSHALAQVPGGYTERKVTDPDVIAAADFALKTVEEKKITGDRILRAASQVVAGTNYRLDLQVIDSSGDKPVKREAQVVVYRNLDDEYKLTSWKWEKKEE